MNGLERDFCGLAPAEEPLCPARPVVAVRDVTEWEAWGCETHAAAALAAIDGARIGRVTDWDACGRLLSLPWNRRSPGHPGRKG